MKKVLCAICAACLVFSLFGCGKKENAQLANPWQEVESLGAAGDLAGFTLNAPGFVGYCSMDAVRVCTPEDSRMIEVIYRNGDDEVRLRKAPGADDISGDYGQYDSQASVEIAGRTVSMQGNGELVRVAAWQDGEFTYSVTATPGLPLDDVTEFIASVK